MFVDICCLLYNIYTIYTNVMFKETFIIAILHAVGLYRVYIYVILYRVKVNYPIKPTFLHMFTRLPLTLLTTLYIIIW